MEPLWLLSGAVLEYKVLHELLPRLVPGINKQQMYPHNREQTEQMLAPELVRSHLLRTLFVLHPAIKLTR